MVKINDESLELIIFCFPKNMGFIAELQNNMCSLYFKHYIKVKEKISIQRLLLLIVFVYIILV